MNKIALWAIILSLNSMSCRTPGLMVMGEGYVAKPEATTLECKNLAFKDVVQPTDKPPMCRLIAGDGAITYTTVDDCSELILDNPYCSTEWVSSAQRPK